MISIFLLEIGMSLSWEWYSYKLCVSGTAAQGKLIGTFKRKKIPCPLHSPHYPKI